MPDDTVICTECGKEVPASLPVCEECGASHFRGRAPRKGVKRESPGDRVAGITDRLRSVPRAPARRPSAHAKRKRSRRSEVRPAPRPAPVRNPEADTAAGRQASGHADPAPPPGAKRIARRKIYRYAETKRKSFLYGPEVRAVVFVLLLGAILILMCHMQQASAQAEALSEAPRALVGSPLAAPETNARPSRRPGAEQGGSKHDQVHQLLVVPARHERRAEDARGQGGRIPGH